MKHYSVKISEEARESLKAHICFIARINPDAAKKTKKVIMENIRSLGISPYQFRSLDEYDPHCRYRLMFVPKWYGVIYLIEDDKVFVEDIIDIRQDYGWLLSRYIPQE